MRKAEPTSNKFAPRYTPGSPGQVPRELGERVAAEERLAFARAIEGAYGEAERQRAERLGLAGIVELRIERRKEWDVLDLITGDVFSRPFPHAK